MSTSIHASARCSGYRRDRSIADPDPYHVRLAKAFMKEEHIPKGGSTFDFASLLAAFLDWCDEHGMDTNGASP